MSLETFAKILIEQGCNIASEARTYDIEMFEKAFSSYRDEVDVETVLNFNGELPDIVRKAWSSGTTEAENNLVMEIRMSLIYKFDNDLQEILDQYKGEDEQIDCLLEDNSERMRSINDELRKTNTSL